MLHRGFNTFLSGSEPPLVVDRPGRTTVAVPGGEAVTLNGQKGLASSVTMHAGLAHHWWPTEETGSRAAFDGNRGRFAHADRNLGVFAVKTSQWPEDGFLSDRRFRDVSCLGPSVRAPAAAPLP